MTASDEEEAPPDDAAAVDGVSPEAQEEQAFVAASGIGEDARRQSRFRNGLRRIAGAARNRLGGTPWLKE